MCDWNKGPTTLILWSMLLRLAYKCPRAYGLLSVKIGHFVEKIVKVSQQDKSDTDKWEIEKSQSSIVCGLWWIWTN